MSEGQIRPNLLTVIPGNITIENFVPGRVYKETLMIYNTCNVPIIISLKSSDKSKLTISETKLRIGVNQASKLDLLIQDKINYKYIKTPTKQKRLFIHMKGDLIDEKYEINLLYYDKNKSKIIQNNNINQHFNNNNNRLNHIRNENANQMLLNAPYLELPQEYLTENPNNFINKQEINPNIENYNNHFSIKYYDENDNNNFSNENIIDYTSAKQNVNEETIKLKKIIKELTEQCAHLQSLLDKNKSNNTNNIKNDKNILNISHNSFYIFGSNFEKQIKAKYKLDDNIEIQRILSKNKILELENSTLLYRIKCLEKKLSLFDNNINLNEEGFENDLIDEGINPGNYIEESNYQNRENGDVLLKKNNNLNYGNYKYIYEGGKKEKYRNDIHNNQYFREKNNNNLQLYNEKRNEPFSDNINSKKYINQYYNKINEDNSL